MTAYETDPTLDIAIDLVIGVRDEGRAYVNAVARSLSPDKFMAVVVQLAELVPDDKPASQLLAWKRRRFPQAAPTTVRKLRPRQIGLVLARCGTAAGWAQHMADKTEVCGPCEREHRKYERRAA